MSSVHIHAHPEIPPPRLEEVSDGIYAYIQPDGSWGLNNPGFLVGEDAVTVIDTCFTEARSRAFRDAIRSVTDRPPRTLVNTHHHGDHTYGNFVFPETTIIGHDLCREAVLATGLSITPFFPGVQWGNIEMAPPFVTFSDRLTVYVDDLRVELMFVGPAHTTNDVAVWIPERGLLFAGDLVFNRCTPFVLQGSLSGLLRALDVVKGLGATTVVPGHGELCGPEAIDDNIEYLRFVEQTARQGFDAGAAPLDVARETDLGRFGEWHETERFVANVHRAYSEMKAEPLAGPLPLQDIFKEMIESNAGQPIRCFA